MQNTNSYYMFYTLQNTDRKFICHYGQYTEIPIEKVFWKQLQDMGFIWNYITQRNDGMVFYRLMKIDRDKMVCEF